MGSTSSSAISLPGAVVELSRVWAFVRRHCLRVFERDARQKVRGDACSSKNVAANLPLRPASAVRRRTISCHPHQFRIVDRASEARASELPFILNTCDGAAGNAGAPFRDC